MPMYSIKPTQKGVEIRESDFVGLHPTGRHRYFSGNVSPFYRESGKFNTANPGSSGEDIFDEIFSALEPEAFIKLIKYLERGGA